MISLTFAEPKLEQLRGSLRHDELESAAMLLCVPMRLESSDGWRLIVREVHVATENDYIERTSVSVRLNTAFGLALEKKAKLNGWSIVYVHTHPRQHPPVFSPIDDKTDVALGAYTSRRCPGHPHLSMLLGRDAARARLLGDLTLVRVIEVGATLKSAFDPEEPDELDKRYDRQVRAFGPEGQARLARLTVGIVGLGGTGSLVAQQLAHLGVRDFILVDADIIEETNLNRVVGTHPGDVDEAQKVSVAARLIKCLQPRARVFCLPADVTKEGVARRVIEADLVFNCTDTHASRHVLNQAAYQFLTPVIDMGVSITVDKDMKAQFAGRSKMLAPGLACLWCAKQIDPEQVRREMMTDEQRAGDPYVQGASGVHQPAVISINGVVTSVAVTMLLSAVAGVPAPARYVYYDGNRSRMNAVSLDADPACVFCGPQSTAGWGDTYSLPTQPDD